MGLLQGSVFTSLALVLSVGCGEVKTDVADSGTPDANTQIDIDAAAPDAMPISQIDQLCGESSPLLDYISRRVECDPDLMLVRFSDNGLLRGRSAQERCKTQYEEEVDAGNITVNTDAFAACANYLDGRPCDQTVFDNIAQTPCGDIFRGHIPSGQGCATSRSCEGDAYCKIDEGDCGFCTAMTPENSSCVRDEECTTGYCRGDVCAPRRALNQNCNGRNDCVGQLVCDNGICTSQAPFVGMSCEDSEECSNFDLPGVNGLYCEISTGQKTDGECRRLPNVGEPCIAGDDNDLNLPLCNFHEYEWCDPQDNICKAPILGAAGQSCSSFYSPALNGAVVCPEGFRCPSPFAAVEEDPLSQCLKISYPGESCEAYTPPHTDFPMESTCEGLVPCENGLCQIDQAFCSAE